MSKSRIDRYTFQSGRTAEEMISALQEIPGDTIILDIEEDDVRSFAQPWANYIITAEREITE